MSATLQRSFFYRARIDASQIQHECVGIPGFIIMRAAGGFTEHRAAVRLKYATALCAQGDGGGISGLPIKSGGPGGVYKCFYCARPRIYRL